jgi:hypothetical protein
MFQRLLRARTLRYGEGIVAHSPTRSCPYGYERIHPIIMREEFLTWQWMLGGLVERWINLAHRLPLLARWLDEVYCARYEGIRGPFMPIRSWPSVEIPWSQSARPYKEARFAELNAKAADLQRTSKPG